MKTSPFSTLKAGSRLRYNDGRPGHDVGATVLSVGEGIIVVQFDDRADTTTIRLSDRNWTDFLSVES